MSEEELLKIDSGCTCKRCTKLAEERLTLARNEWKDGKREIIVRNCDTDEESGQMVVVNDFTISQNGENTEDVINGMLRFLEIDNVEIEKDDDYKY